MRRILSLLLCCLCASSFAQSTVNLTYTFQDYLLNPQAVRRIVLTPITPPPGNYTNVLLAPVPSQQVTGTNGSFTFSNVVVGYMYQFELDTANQRFLGTNYILPTDTGNVNARDRIGIATGPYFAFFNPTNLTLAVSNAVNALSVSAFASNFDTNGAATNFANAASNGIVSIIIATNQIETNYTLLVSQSATNYSSNSIFSYSNSAVSTLNSASNSILSTSAGYANAASNQVISELLLTNTALSNFAYNGLSQGTNNLNSASNSLVSSLNSASNVLLSATISSNTSAQLYAQNLSTNATNFAGNTANTLSNNLVSAISSATNAAQSFGTNYATTNVLTYVATNASNFISSTTITLSNNLTTAILNATNNLFGPLTNFSTTNLNATIATNATNFAISTANTSSNSLVSQISTAQGNAITYSTGVSNLTYSGRIPVTNGVSTNLTLSATTTNTGTIIFPAASPSQSNSVSAYTAASTGNLQFDYSQLAGHQLVIGQNGVVEQTNNAAYYIGNGGGLTNISLMSVITNLGSAAYSNSSAFDLAGAAASSTAYAVAVSNALNASKLNVTAGSATNLTVNNVLTNNGGQLYTGVGAPATNTVEEYATALGLSFIYSGAAGSSLLVGSNTITAQTNISTFFGGGGQGLSNVPNASVTGLGGAALVGTNTFDLAATAFTVGLNDTNFANTKQIGSANLTNIQAISVGNFVTNTQSGAFLTGLYASNAVISGNITYSNSQTMVDDFGNQRDNFTSGFSILDYPWGSAGIRLNKSPATATYSGPDGVSQIFLGTNEFVLGTFSNRVGAPATQDWTSNNFETLTQASTLQNGSANLTNWSAIQTNILSTFNFGSPNLLGSLVTTFDPTKNYIDGNHVGGWAQTPVVQGQMYWFGSTNYPNEWVMNGDTNTVRVYNAGTGNFTKQANNTWFIAITNSVTFASLVNTNGGTLTNNSLYLMWPGAVIATNAILSNATFLGSISAPNQTTFAQTANNGSDFASASTTLANLHGIASTVGGIGTNTTFVGSTGLTSLQIAQPDNTSLGFLMTNGVSVFGDPSLMGVNASGQNPQMTLYVNCNPVYTGTNVIGTSSEQALDIISKCRAQAVYTCYAPGITNAGQTNSTFTSPVDVQFGASGDLYNTALFIGKGVVGGVDLANPTNGDYDLVAWSPAVNAPFDIAWSCTTMSALGVYTPIYFAANTRPNQQKGVMHFGFLNTLAPDPQNINWQDTLAVDEIHGTVAITNGITTVLSVAASSNMTANAGSLVLANNSHTVRLTNNTSAFSATSIFPGTTAGGSTEQEFYVSVYEESVANGTPGTMTTSIQWTDRFNHTQSEAIAGTLTLGITDTNTAVSTSGMIPVVTKSNTGINITTVISGGGGGSAYSLDTDVIQLR